MADEKKSGEMSINEFLVRLDELRAAASRFYRHAEDELGSKRFALDDQALCSAINMKVQIEDNKRREESHKAYLSELENVSFHRHNVEIEIKKQTVQSERSAASLESIASSLRDLCAGHRVVSGT